MKRKQNSYEALLAEEQELTLLLEEQEKGIQQQLLHAKDKFSSIAGGLDVLGRLIHPDKNNPLLYSAVSALVRGTTRNILRKRTGWLGRLLIPFVLKNVLSHVAGDHKEKINRVLLALLGGNDKARHNGKAAPQEAVV